MASSNKKARDLAKLYGVGKKTQAKLLAGFASAEEVFRAIKHRDVAAFTRRGFSKRFTIRLIRKVTTRGLAFLQTPDARKEYRKLVRILAEYPHTEPARDLVKLLAPLRKEKAITRRNAQVLAAKKFYASLSKKKREKLASSFERGWDAGSSWDAYARALQWVVIATDDKATLDRYQNRFEVHFFGDQGELAELHQTVPFLRVVTTQQVTPDAGLVVFVIGTPEHEVVPELAVSQVASKEHLLRLYLELAAVVPDRFQARDHVQQVVSVMDAPDKTLNRLEELQVEWDERLDHVLTRLAKSGQPFVSSVELSDACEEEIGLDLPLPEFADLPISQVEVVLELGKDRAYESRLFTNAARLQKKLGKSTQLRALEREVVMFDYWLALGRFSHEFNMVLPQFSRDEDTLYIRGAENLFLTREVQRGTLERVDPVDYVLGTPPEKIDRIDNERLALLTGANSGGKSCLLETIFHVTLLAYMGLLVPASYCIVPSLDMILYHRRHTSRTAGALEGALKKFVPAFIKPGRKLVLVDEFEAITEPGAAARILIGLINLLIPRKALGVFVTHLSQEIAKLVGPAVRVDAVTARGLDKDLNLITDHQPVFSQAGRSTPELIVTKLTAQAKTKSLQDAYTTVKRALDQYKVVWQTRIDWYLERWGVKKNLTRVNPPESDSGGAGS